jgi:hypothetical protein
VQQAGLQISPSDQSQVINFYSQISNLKTLLASHQQTSQLFAWLEKNTEANVSYQSFDFSAGNRITLKGDAVTEADINQQLAIFENAPEVASVAVSNVSNVQSGSGYQFTIVLTVNPSIFSPSTQ